MLKEPDGGTTVELSPFVRPNHTAGSAAMAHELGLPSLVFEVDDLRAVVDQLAADGYRLVGGIGEYEGAWLMAYVWVRRGSLLPWRNGCADPGEFPNVGAIPAQ
ncbi:hypothetical protein ART_0578 [Arthrobacter sp. PAMC 25486]|uniref:VOC family protein n=1 Tax=Arthrobacter sp. PAMC 25486 TaxID=1494608 RepID=UPI0005362B78|nr:hypothetical protein ART_0578 [Arthrobacter sp. PAMC 25486]